MNNRYVNPSGFAENLPAEQVVEDRFKDTIREVAESFGYSRLETASVEYMETLASKGEVDKEIYTIGRAMAEDGTEEADRGLHFDLTVPFARYVAQNQGDLQFPYRRFQIQKVWRGERPQKGRFREFYQADVDVVAIKNLSPAFDAEVAIVMATILNELNIGTITISLNNRKFLGGLFESNGISDTERALQIVDKLDKIGQEKVSNMLQDEVGISSEKAEVLLAVLSRKVPLAEVEAFLSTITDENESLVEGKKELKEIFEILETQSGLNNISFVLHPSIARGLDYYTGTVYETTIDGYEKYGSICSGGRYADLASRFTRTNLPGVGMSIGLTRLLSILKEENLVSFEDGTNTDIVVCLLKEEALLPSLLTATQLRKKGLKVQNNYKYKDGLGKQLEQASQKNIPYALVCEDDNTYTLFNLKKESKETLSSIGPLISAISE